MIIWEQLTDFYQFVLNLSAKFVLKEISSTITDGLAQALIHENELAEQADFKVDIVSLK